MVVMSKSRLEAMYAGQTRPLVFGHRGAMAYAPMNTLAAYNLAYEQGADGIELDVWLSQDDVPVVIHDFEVDHTTDGTGRVGSMSLAELKELDAGSWFDEKYVGERIPTLDEVFESVGNKLFVNVEIKSAAFRNERIVEKVVACIGKHTMTDRVLISSFNPFVLREMRKQSSTLPIGLLRDADMSKWGYLLVFGTKYDAWHPHYKQITAENVQDVHGQGRRINVWTLNDPDEAVRLHGLGVDGFVTDNPDKILAAIT